MHMGGCSQDKHIMHMGGCSQGVVHHRKLSALRHRPEENLVWVDGGVGGELVVRGRDSVHGSWA